MERAPDVIRVQNNYDVEAYAFSFLVRSLWSLVILMCCVTGYILVHSDITGNDYKLEKGEQLFETLFFTVTAVIEGLSSLSNMFLYCYQRNKPDLSHMNTFDCKSSCFYNMFRIVWTLALSIFVLMDVDSFFKAGDPYKTITSHHRNKARKEWGAIGTLTTVIMMFEIIYILGYVVGLLYQPADFSREICFDQIGGGVITEVDAMARMEQLKE